MAPVGRLGRGWARIPAVLRPGTPAPPFTLPDQDGVPFSLSDVAGQWVLLWWYPKAATPG